MVISQFWCFLQKTKKNKKKHKIVKKQKNHKNSQKNTKIHKKSSKNIKKYPHYVRVKLKNGDFL